jgi:hypothetical protein
MATRGWHILFSQHDLRAVLESRLRKARARVLAIDSVRFDRESDDLLAASIASELVASPLELLEDAISVGATDARVGVSDDGYGSVFDDSEPAYANGLRVSYHVPFSGDATLLKCRPSTFTLSPPSAVVQEHELTFEYERADRDVAATKPVFERDLGEIRQWLAWVNQQVSEYNSSLEPTVRSHVEHRRHDLDKAASDLSGLGYAVRQVPPPLPPSVPAPSQAAAARRQARRQAKHREYDVALSFAGEDRGYVGKVAQSLKALGVTVFYDGFEQVTLWGRDLAEHLARIYSEDAHFVVLFASAAYARKAWPNHEKQHALGRHLRGETGRILPVRMDDTEIPGLPPTMGYLDCRALTPEKLAELVRQKVDEEREEA